MFPGENVNQSAIESIEMALYPDEYVALYSLKRVKCAINVLTGKNLDTRGLNTVHSLITVRPTANYSQGVSAKKDKAMMNYENDDEMGGEKSTPY